MQDKKIIVAVTGSIAAYKSAELVRRLRDSGAEVRVVMTQGACEFVTPMTFQALSGNPVHVALLDASAEAAMGHIELARWADVILIAPASANTLARLAVGMADDLLATLCLATFATIALAPAMNQLMWANAATRMNVSILQQRGMQLFGPGRGEQACGDVGEGRMLEPVELVDNLLKLLDKNLPMAGYKLMVTAGPTYEDIDPVRYIGNRSSGKMGYAIAAAAARWGAEVLLVSGPVGLDCPVSVQREYVRSANDMHSCVMSNIKGIDIFISAAAVADFRPTELASQKLKKGAAEMNIKLLANPDILREVASLAEAPFTVGFAAETENVEQYARDKLKDKCLDMICANQVGCSSGGFEDEQNAIEVYWQDGGYSLPMMGKTELSGLLLKQVMIRYGVSERG